MNKFPIDLPYTEGKRDFNPNHSHKLKVENDQRLRTMSNPPSLYRDPWAKREAWRKHPVFSNRAMFRNLFPGFGIAVAAFSIYVVAENVLQSEKSHQTPKR